MSVERGEIFGFLGPNLAIDSSFTWKYHRA
jgi:hypothetical protein